MNRAYAQIFVDVLAFAGHAAEGADQLAQLRASEWDASLTWLDQCGLTLYFWQRVQESGLQHAIPPEVCAKFVERKRQNSIRTQVMLQEWRQLQQLFRSANMNCIVLKGLSKVPDYCPDPSFRVQFDHDWLIEKNSIAQMHESLSSAGFQEKPIQEKDRIVYVPCSSSRGGSWQPADSYSAAVQRPVEIHIELWDCRNEAVLLTLPKDFLARSVHRIWGSDEFVSLCDEDVLLFEVLHAFRHVIHSWCRLSVFYELARFLNRKSSDKNFWLRFRTRIEDYLRLRQVAGIILTLAASLFKQPEVVRSLPAEFFQLTPYLRMWIERYGIQSALGSFAADKFNLFLLREFVNDAGRWRSLRNQRLFPLGQLLRPRSTAVKKGSAGFGTKMGRGLTLARRTVTHLNGTLAYAFEYPRWKFLSRRELNKKTSFLSATSSPKDAQRSDLPASRLESGRRVPVTRG